MNTRTLQTLFFAGLAAAVLSMVAELLLWPLAGMPLPESLYRDTRLAAAMLMGEGVIAPSLLPTRPPMPALLVAGAIHFALCFFYAAAFLTLQRRWRAASTAVAVLRGAVLGLLVYLVNMFGFTEAWPWFALARDWVTVSAHMVFGASIAWVVYRRAK